MTVSSRYEIVRISGNGATTTWPFPYPIFAPGDLAVALFDAGGNTVVTTLNGGGANDYTVTGNQDPDTLEYASGVSVAFNSAIPSGYSGYIAPNLAVVQPLLLTDYGPLSLPALMAQLDRLTLLAGQVALFASLAVTFPIQEAAAAPLLPGLPGRIGAVLGFDGSGAFTTYALDQAGQIGDASLVTYTAPWASAGEVQLSRMLQSVVMAWHFLAFGDGTLQTAKLQAMINYALPLGRKMFLPAGDYQISGALFVGNGIGFRFQGESQGSVTITQQAANTPILEINGTIDQSFEISDFTGSWAAQASSGQTGAAIVQIDDLTSSGHDWQMTRVTGYYGCRMASSRLNNSSWGFKMSDCWRDTSMVGAMLYIPGGGVPRLSIENCYALIGNTQFEELVSVSGCDTLEIDQLEINGHGSFVFSSFAAIALTSGNLVARLVRGEQINLGSSGAMILVSQGGGGAYATLTDVGCNANIADGTTCATVKFAGFVDVELNGVTASTNAGSTGMLVPYNPGAAGITTIDSAKAIHWYDTSGTILPHYDPRAIYGNVAAPNVDYDVLLGGGVHHLGDAGIGTAAVAITGVSGDGSHAIITYSGGGTFTVGGFVYISGETPNGYNGWWPVTAASAGSVTISCGATGAQSVAGKIADGAWFNRTVSFDGAAMSGDHTAYLPPPIHGRKARAVAAHGTLNGHTLTIADSYGSATTTISSVTTVAVVDFEAIGGNWVIASRNSY